MTLKAEYPRFFEVSCFTLAYFGAYAVSMLLIGGTDPKFGGYWGTVEFAIAIIVTPSSLAAAVAYSLARWAKLGRRSATSAPDLRIAFSVAFGAVLGALGIYEVCTRLPDGDWQLFPWEVWILGGGPLLLTLIARAWMERRRSARSVAV